MHARGWSDDLAGSGGGGGGVAGVAGGATAGDDEGARSLDLGKPLNCMSVARHPGAALVCAVGGAQMLKVVSITPRGMVEKKNLRLTSKVTSEVNFSINDVEWCLKDSSRNVLASGASNGNIILWDISRDGRTSQERVISAHPRTVNRINWHPQEEDVLLSASQDTTVKLWDRRGRGYECGVTFHPRSESVRDVQWNPSQVHLFAAACENGSVHIWDRRRPGGPLLKIMGHNGLVLALEWHLTEPFLLATGARDRTVKVWDVSDPSRDELRERHLINTVSAVNRIKWRPGHPEQLTTTSSVQGDNAIHLWNVRHPYLPLATLEGHDDVCGSITWLDTPCLPRAAGEGGGGGGTGGTGAGGQVLAASADSGGSGGGLATSSSSGGGGGGGSSGGSGHHKSMSQRLFGSWGAAWGETFAARDEDEKGLEQYTEYLGVWQHLVSCGRDGKVIFHSLARAARPRDTLTPAVVALSCRGDLATAFERIDRSNEFVGLVDDDNTRHAPGIFADQPPAAAAAAAPTTHGGEHGSLDSSLTGGEAVGGGSSQGSNHAAPPAVSSSAAASSRQPAQSSPRMHPSSSLSAVVGAQRQQQQQQQQQRQHSMNRSASAPAGQQAQQRQVQLSGGASAALTGPMLSVGAAEPARTASLDSSAAGPSSDMGLSAASSLVPGWLPRFIYKLQWDEPALRGTSTAEVIEALERRMALEQAGMEEEEEEEDEGGDASAGRAAPTVVRFKEQVAHLARGYVLRPQGVPLPLASARDCHRAREDLCQHNAELARVAGQLRMAHVWEVLGVLLPALLEPGANNGGSGNGSSSSSGFDFATGRHQGDGRLGGQGNPQQALPEPVDAAASSCLQLLRRELLTCVVEELLEEGDVQNCVAVMEVVAATGRGLLGETLADLIDVPKERVRECYLGYIELLHRLELWPAANELVAQVDDKPIQQLHVTNTTTYAACAACRRPVSTVDTPWGPQASPWCGKCRALVSQCAICLQPVRGVYVWCPGCGHGGHVAHMQEWFLRGGNRECPTGCGHVCNLFPSTTAAAAAAPQGLLHPHRPRSRSRAASLGNGL